MHIRNQLYLRSHTVPQRLRVSLFLNGEDQSNYDVSGLEGASALSELLPRILTYIQLSLNLDLLTPAGHPSPGRHSQLGSFK